MEISNTIIRMMERMSNPCFLVKDETILYVNNPAASMQIQPNMPLKKLLAADCSYATSPESMISVKLTTQFGRYTATVEQLEGFDLFVMDSDNNFDMFKVLALASTQIRQPLTTLMHTVDESNPDANKALHQLHRIVSNMSDTYRYLLNRTPKLEPTEISNYMAELMEAIATHIASIHVKLTYQGLSQSLYCLIDKELLKRAILNLVSNSVKANCTEIFIKLSRCDNQLALTVEDNGKGITNHLSGHMFGGFLRDPADFTEGGAGLGMQFVQFAAHAHGGTVLVQHTPTGGASVTMTLTVMNASPSVHSPVLTPDYLGGRDHLLTELADILPSSLY